MHGDFYPPHPQASDNKAADANPKSKESRETQSKDKAKQLFLPLAEKLIDKYFAENEIDSEAEVRLYLLVLSKLNKIDKKLRVLDGPPGVCVCVCECMCMCVCVCECVCVCAYVSVCECVWYMCECVYVRV